MQPSPETNRRDDETPESLTPDQKSQAIQKLCQHTPWVRKLVRRAWRNTSLPQSADYEDMCQAVISHVLKKISWWQPSEPFLPWLSVVVTRKAIDLRRAWMANRVHLYFSEFAEEPACGDGEPDLEESIEAWRACIPPQRFQVVELLKEGMGLSEIAANLKISQRTLQYWLSEIRAAVRAFNRR